ncbi:unnamed protein product, partial [Rotaria sp. Silwood2]
MLIVDIRSSTVCQLDLQGYDACSYNEWWFNDEQCARCRTSPIGNQFEGL